RERGQDVPGRLDRSADILLPWHAHPECGRDCNSSGKLSGRLCYRADTVTMLAATRHDAIGCELMSKATRPSNGAGRIRFLVLHGPNTNLFGRREPNIYGSETLAFIDQKIRQLAQELDVEVLIQQSNHEGVLVD